MSDFTSDFWSIYIVLITLVSINACVVLLKAMTTRRMAPGEKATWTVTVKALKAGDVRFKTKMTSDQLGRPVEETEATNLYE